MEFIRIEKNVVSDGKKALEGTGVYADEKVRLEIN